MLPSPPRPPAVTLDQFKALVSSAFCQPTTELLADTLTLSSTSVENQRAPKRSRSSPLSKLKNLLSTPSTPTKKRAQSIPTITVIPPPEFLPTIDEMKPLEQELEELYTPYLPIVYRYNHRRLLSRGRDVSIFSRGRGSLTSRSSSPVSPVQSPESIEEVSPSSPPESDSSCPSTSESPPRARQFARFSGRHYSDASDVSPTPLSRKKPVITRLSLTSRPSHRALQSRPRSLRVARPDSKDWTLVLPEKRVQKGRMTSPGLLTPPSSDEGHRRRCRKRLDLETPTKSALASPSESTLGRPLNRGRNGSPFPFALTYPKAAAPSSTIPSSSSSSSISTSRLEDSDHHHKSAATCAKVISHPYAYSHPASSSLSYQSSSPKSTLSFSSVSKPQRLILDRQLGLPVPARKSRRRYASSARSSASASGAESAWWVDSEEDKQRSKWIMLENDENEEDMAYYTAHSSLTSFLSLS
ncbi:hypothetical protein C8J56DRAFT_290241 [Mycena floridula]|nr:hypothetical protein C8J56DRAFT_290241 [Mycena floridula]